MKNKMTSETARSPKKPTGSAAGKVPGSRELALRILLAQAESGRPLDQVLAEEIPQPWPVDPRDRQLLLALVYGVLRWQGLLDEVMSRYARHPLERMKPLTRQAIRLGLAQLLVLDRVPPRAAVNETVKALKVFRQPAWLTGFVNALLRNVDRDLDKLRLLKEQQGDWLSHPAWLRRRWRERMGETAAMARCRANNLAPPLVLRVNPAGIAPARLQDKLLAAGIEAGPGRYAPAALVLPDYHGPVEELPGYALGHFAVQDEAAQLVTLLIMNADSADPKSAPNSIDSGSNQRPSFPPASSAGWLDACAGLGGKTAHLAELQPVGTGLTALEPNSGRFSRLQTNLARLGFAYAFDQVATGQDNASPAATASPAAIGPPPANPPATLRLVNRTLAEFADRLDFTATATRFQGILVDAPCSGLGVIRRHPDLRWNRQAADLPRYHRQQLALLQAAAALLAPGGVLVYVVCSNEPEENEQVIDAFLKQKPEPGLQVTDPRLCLPVAARELVDEKGFFRSSPEAGLDGFFAARLQKM